MTECHVIGRAGLPGFPGLDDLYSEKCPNDRPLNEPGVKADAGKVMASLLFTDFGLALNEVARVGTFGAKKYTKHGWRSVNNGIERYTDAMVRHLISEQKENLDKDSQLMHAAHLAWNALARLQLLLSGKENFEDKEFATNINLKP